MKLLFMALGYMSNWSGVGFTLFVPAIIIVFLTDRRSSIVLCFFG